MTKPIRHFEPMLLALVLSALPATAAAVEASAVWDSRCEECHGQADEFSGKYLWAIEGQLQGQHHVQDLRLFMSNHYVPAHLLDLLQTMLAQHANTPARFATDCGACHGSFESFARESVEFRWRKVRGVKSGVAVDEFLPTHQGLQEADADFYVRLLSRFAPQPEEPEKPAKPETAAQN